MLRFFMASRIAVNGMESWPRSSCRLNTKTVRAGPVMCHRNVAGGNYAGIILHRNYRLTPPTWSNSIGFTTERTHKHTDSLFHENIETNFKTC